MTQLLRRAVRIRTVSGVALGVALCFGCGSGESTTDPTVSVEYLGHASFMLRSPGGTKVLLDPYASQVWIGYDFPPNLDPDAVVITHPHYDHDAGRYRGAELPWPHAVVVDAPGRFEIGDVSITGIEGKHADPYGMEFGQLNTIMIVEVAGLRIAHVGDNGPVSAEALAAIGAVDVLMMPMDAAYHILSPEETEQLRQDIPHRILIPMHYRIPALELESDAPADLGPIAPVLGLEERIVRRVGTHEVRLARDDLPEEQTIMVFEHSPRIPLPSRR